MTCKCLTLTLKKRHAFRRATPASDGFEAYRVTEIAKPSEIRGFALGRHAQRDSIPPYETTGKAAFDGEGGAHSGARDDADAILADDDAGLALIVEAWPMLSADVRRKMLDLVERDLPAIVTPAGKSVSR